MLQQKIQVVVVEEAGNGEVGVVPDVQSAASEPLAVAQPVSEIEFNVSPQATPSREEKKVDLSRTTVHIPDFLELVSVSRSASTHTHTHMGILR